MGLMDRTRKVVAECLGREVNEVQADSRLVSDLGADSMDLLELVFLLEREFDVRLQTEELFPDERDERRETMQRLSVTDIVAVVQEKVSPRAECHPRPA